MTYDYEWTQKYHGTKDYYRVYSALITAAQHRGLVTYQEVAAIMGLPLRGSHMGRETGLMLGTIAVNELNRDRPMLSAISVDVKHQPGKGFFQLALDVGLLQSEHPVDQQQFWEAQVEAIYNEWKIDYKS